MNKQKSFQFDSHKSLIIYVTISVYAWAFIMLNSKLNKNIIPIILYTHTHTYINKIGKINKENIDKVIEMESLYTISIIYAWKKTKLLSPTSIYKISTRLYTLHQQLHIYIFTCVLLVIKRQGVNKFILRKDQQKKPI